MLSSLQPRRRLPNHRCRSRRVVCDGSCWGGGLLGPPPIPVKWRESFLPLSGPMSVAVSSERFAPLPGVTPAGLEQLRAGQIGDLLALYGKRQSQHVTVFPRRPSPWSPK